MAFKLRMMVEMRGIYILMLISMTLTLKTFEMLILFVFLYFVLVFSASIARVVSLSLAKRSHTDTVRKLL